MSRTYRKDKEGNKFPEGNPLRNPNVNYRCRCEWCTNEDKRKSEEKWYDRQITLYLHGSSKENTDSYI